MRRRTWLAALVIAVLLALGAGKSLAHDFWIQPSAFIAPGNAEIAARLLIGHGDEINEFPYLSHFIVRFEIHGPDGVEKVKSRNASRPAVKTRLGRAGIYTVAYQSRHSYVELEAERFVPYLREEGLTEIIAERERRGEAEKSGQESFARYCKALIRVGKSKKGFDRKLGLPFELTAIDNPFTAGRKSTLRFVLEYQGKPMSGAHVELISLDDLDDKLVGRTDKRGRVSFKIPHAGRWMVASTHMRRAPSSVKGDWESFWATLTFEVPGKK